MIQKQPLANVLAYGLCPVLLALAGFGFWRLYNWAATQTQLNQQDLISVLGLAIGPLMLFALCAVLALALMGYNSALNATQSKLEASHHRQKYLEELVKALSEFRPGATVILDQEARYCYVNRHAAQGVDYSPDDMVGRPIERIIGMKDGLKLKLKLQEARMTGQVQTFSSHLRRHDQDVYTQTHVIPLPEIMEQSGAVMVYEDDVTNLMVEREARERQFRQIIDTLVAVVDRRDPYAAGHSATWASSHVRLRRKWNCRLICARRRKLQVCS